jgi:hypothetical protein
VNPQKPAPWQRPTRVKGDAPGTAFMSRDIIGIGIGIGATIISDEQN